MVDHDPTRPIRPARPTREDRQELLLRLVEASLRATPALGIEEWLADAEAAFRTSRERLAGDLLDAWREECGRLEGEE
jgi:hypothetical protein